MIRKIQQYIFLFFISFIVSVPLSAQLAERAKEFFHIEANTKKTDSISTDTVGANGKHLRDSIHLDELTAQLQEMKLNEILLRTELDKVSSNAKTDSLKKAEQRRRVDSLRIVTPGVPIIIGGDTLFMLYAQRGGLTPQKRAQITQDKIDEIGSNYSIGMDSIYALETEFYTDIMYGDKVIISITDHDALWQNLTRAELVNRYIPIIKQKIIDLKQEYSILNIVKRVGFFVLILIIQFGLWKFTNYLFRKLRRKIIWVVHNKLKSITIKNYEFLDTHRQGLVLLFFSHILRYAVILMQLVITVPMLFSIIPQTEELAVKLFGYVMNPVKMVITSIVSYIPNLFIIIVIYYCIKYLIKGVQYIAGEIESGKLKITGFYPDWARPTLNIIRFLLYVFMIAMIYPYLPGADSGVFQGISVFVGLIVSLGSSSAIANIIAGLVITYMRPFKIGDRIKLSDTEGNVVEKTPFVTRIRTPKNEIVTIPNAFIMSSHTTNFSESAQQYGLIIHTKVTLGYDVPWQQAHDILIEAAKETPRIMANPKPFVLELELHDYYVVYQINGYIKEPDKLAQIYSDLHQKIQEKTNEAGIELLSPHYYAQRDGNSTVLPPDFVKKD